MMNFFNFFWAGQEELVRRASEVAGEAAQLVDKVILLAQEASNIAAQASQSHALDPVIIGLTILVLAIFVGYYVVWHVTPALHSPLMAVTNAISSVIIVGALLAAGTTSGAEITKIFGFIAVLLASINIFGGFLVTRRMLGMFKKRH